MLKSKNNKQHYCQGDCMLEIRGLFEELILTMLNNDNARENLHVKYVSPEWVGNPGWYFWPKERKGVYFLKLTKVTPLGGGLESLLQLFYYPHPQEDIFRQFSFVEQLTRVSHVFQSTKPQQGEACPCHSQHEPHDFADLIDGIGVPVPQVRSELNPWLYRLGEVICYWEKGKMVYLGFEAQVRSQTWSYGNIKSVPERGKSKVLLEGYEMDRDLPAWELTKNFCLELLNDLKTIGISSETEEVVDFEDSSGINKIRFKLNYGSEMYRSYEEKSV